MSKLKLAVLGFVSVLSGIGCSDAAVELAEIETASIEEPIIDGTTSNGNANFVALYHKTAPGTCGGYTYDEIWWPRPCSGTVIRKDGNVNYVLTARHCITTDGEIGGPLITNPAHMRATSALSPGVIPTNEDNMRLTPQDEPPAYTVSAVYHYTDYQSFGDLAMVKVTGDMRSPQPAERHAILAFGPEWRAEFDRTYLRASGYGRYTSGNCSGHNGSGAGILRNASGFYADVPDYLYFTHDWENSSGQELTYGDSGGPLYTLGVTPNYTLLRIAGVNSQTWQAAGGESLIYFVQRALGSIYMVDVDSVSANQVVVGSAGAVGSLVQMAYSEDNAKTRMKYTQNTNRLMLNGLCLNDEGDNAAVRLRSCGGLQHKWHVKPNGTISNHATGRCLHRPDNSSSLITTTCTSSTRRWAFVADNKVI